jgi:hypothetical protein
MPKSVDELMKELSASMQRAIATARDEGRDDALAQVRMVLGGGASAGAAAAPRRGPGRPKGSTNKATKAVKATKSGKARKNPWAGLSDEERLTRVNAIRKGRGLPLKKKL